MPLPDGKEHANWQPWLASGPEASRTRDHAFWKEAALSPEHPPSGAVAPTHLFVLGCPRSGTTWVQLLLSKHPGVATAPETQVFAYYLDWFRKQWEWERRDREGDTQEAAGLSRLLSGDEFDDLCRGVAEFVLDRIEAGNPGAAVVVEKSPRHALHVEWIRRLLPRARFLHVIRDPRDAAASLFAAGATWAPWAPLNPTDAARLWHDHVSSARRLREETGVYREVRYEDVRADAVGELEAMFAWLELPADRRLCERAVEACRLEKLQKVTSGHDIPIPGRASPSGFFRKGRVGGWRSELRAWQVGVIESVCGELMDELGYERASGPRPGPLIRFRMGLHGALARVREGLDWRLRRIVRRI